MKTKRQSATHLFYSPSTSQNFSSAPIWVYEIKKDDVLPIKFEYKQRGYKGLRFSDRASRIIFD